MTIYILFNIVIAINTNSIYRIYCKNNVKTILIISEKIVSKFKIKTPQTIYLIFILYDSFISEKVATKERILFLRFKHKLKIPPNPNQTNAIPISYASVSKAPPHELFFFSAPSLYLHIRSQPRMSRRDCCSRKIP